MKLTKRNKLQEMNRRDRNVRFADAQMLSEQNNKFFIVLLKILTRDSWMMDINKLYAPSNFFCMW